MADQLASNIRRLREAYGYTQEELAKKLDVTRETLYSWEKGKAEVKFNSAVKLSEIFGVSLDDLARTEVELPQEEIERRVTMQRIEELAERVQDEGLVEHIMTYLYAHKGEVVPRASRRAGASGSKIA